MKIILKNNINLRSLIQIAKCKKMIGSRFSPIIVMNVVWVIEHASFCSAAVSDSLRGNFEANVNADREGTGQMKSSDGPISSINYG